MNGKKLNTKTHKPYPHLLKWVLSTFKSLNNSKSLQVCGYSLTVRLIINFLLQFCLISLKRGHELGFRLAPDAARFQASEVSKNPRGLPSWSVHIQLDSPETALTMGTWIRPGGKTSGVGRGLFWHSPFSKRQRSVQALNGKYLDRSYFALASWIRPLLRKIIMITADLRGRCRQSPIVLGGEGQSLGTKDILSVGTVDTRWSHVDINSVRVVRLYVGASTKRSS